ncbi:MAG: LysR family transcriptional regulator [Betaproteobacteria bacterium]|nr:LysR family transcriptional regulator [Betaproteobacteria bacterium]
MKKLDLNLLPIAVALYDLQNVSRAAQKLGMSQPAVSAALGKLRAQFGDPLFVRTSRGMEPTPRAHTLIAPARDALMRIERDVLSNVAFDAATSDSVFTIAMSDVGEMVFLPKILRGLAERAPNATLRSVSLPNLQLEQGLESGEIDLAIGYFPDLQRSSFFQQRLITHTFVCLLRADHPIRGKRISLKKFLELHHAVVRAESRGQEVFEDFLQQRGIERKVVLRSPHFMSIPMIIARSDLIVTVPHALGMYFEKLDVNLKIVRPQLDFPDIPLKQHWHRRFHSDPKNKWLRGLVAEQFNDGNDEWRIS